MDTSAFVTKFQNLPDELKLQVIEFMEALVSKLKREKDKPGKQTELPAPPDRDEPLVFIPHNGKLLPVTPATEKPDIKALAGIWKDKDITLEKLRREAWGDRL